VVKQVELGLKELCLDPELSIHLSNKQVHGSVQGMLLACSSNDQIDFVLTCEQILENQLS